MKREVSKKFPVGKFIAVIVILAVVAVMVNPSLLFFLTPAQQNVIVQFQATYFNQNNPIQSSDGRFDLLGLTALALLAAECWAVDMVVELIAKKVKLKNRHAETIKSLLCNCAKYAVVIYAIIFGLSILGVNMMAVIASLGVLGLIVGFGAQTLIEDVITGLFIIFEGQFHVGDIVTLDNFRGTVTSIGIRTTQVTDAGGNIKIVNNSDIRTITNLSEVESAAVSIISISYSASLEEAETVVKATLQKLPGEHPEVFQTMPAYVGVEELGASSVDLKVVATVQEPNIYAARRIMNRELKLALDAADIEIPFPQIVVHQAGK
ncbi:MAG: mechanosensitive ion channel family protein [Eubacteriales bacterium]|nr:mechanosensitive ion channel family protein [Eubacteriales bacterium]